MIVTDWPDHYEERAAIIEYCDHRLRPDAERAACNDCIDIYMRQHDATREQAAQALAQAGVPDPVRINRG